MLTNIETNFSLNKGILMANNDYSGICIITGGNNAGKTYALDIMKERYPDAIIMDELELNLDDATKLCLAEKIVKEYSKNHQQTIIGTKCQIFIRAIECYSDVFHIMKDLNVYDMDEHPKNIDLCSNLMYSEHGISSIYQKQYDLYKQLENMIERN